MNRIIRIATQTALAATLLGGSVALAGCSSAPANDAPAPNASAPSGGSDAAPSAPVAVKEGDVAPDFEFTTVDGHTGKLSDYKDKVVLLNFWATWCGYCIREMPDLEKIAADYPDVVVLAVNRGDTVDKAKEAVEEYGYDFVWALDEDHAIEKLYPASGIPLSIIIDKDGTVSTIYNGSAPSMYEYFESAVVKAGAAK